MNSIKKSYLKSSFIKPKPGFNKFIIKNKYRRMVQPGLSRYHMIGQDVSYEYYESCLTHGSNAEILISRVPPIEVDDDIALCFGVQDYGWGHPIEYIQLNNRDTTNPSGCKYCGLRYVMREHEENNTPML